MKSFIRAKSTLVALGLALSAVATFATVASARDQIVLPETASFPESIAIDSTGGIYASSVTLGNIIYLPADGGAPKVFVEGGTHGAISIGGLLLSPQQDILYACSSDLGLNKFSGSAAPGLLAFDVESGALKKRWDLPGGGLCNDLVLAEDGTIYVTDSFVPRILSLKPGADAFETFVQDERFTGEGFNLSGITILDNALIVAKFNSGQFFHIDLTSTPAVAQELQLSQPIYAPDGVRTVDGNGILVAASSGQLVHIEIDGLEAKVTPLDYTFDAPTSLALHGEKIYVLEGQLNKLPAFDPTAVAPEQFTISVLPR